MDAAELDTVKSSIGQALVDASPEKLFGVLGDLGWFELVDVEEAGAVEALFEVQGRMNFALPLLDAVVAAKAGLEFVDTDAIVHSTPEAWDAPPAFDLVNDRGSLAGLILGGADRAERLFKPGVGPEGVFGFATFSVSALDIEPVAGFDPSLRLCRAMADGVDCEFVPTTLPWGEIQSAARRAIAYERVGAAAAILDEACRHVTEREQFGRPIATFQVVRHLLADVHVAIASAAPALEAMWIDPDGELVACTGAAIAGGAGLLAAKNCPQVLGGIGFTFEHPVQAGLCRIQALELMYGNTRQLTAEVGRVLCSRGSVPFIHPMG